MKHLRVFAIVTASAFLSFGAALVACSDDDGDPIPTSDGGTDGTTRDAPGSETGFDAGSDTGSQEDADLPDADDGGVDANIDANVEGGLRLDNFATAVADRMCDALARCCFGSTNVPDGGADGGDFDRDGCKRLYGIVGFENSSVGAFAFDGGNVDLDLAQAAACLTKIDGIAGATCSLTGAGLQDIRTSCFAAVRGKLAAGTSCKASIECGPGHFCKPNGGVGGGDGGILGTCQPLVAQGGNCSVYTTGDDNVDAPPSEEACSYRGGGEPKLRCDSYDYGVPEGYRPRAQWTCQPAVANGQNCNTSVWCTDGICDPDNGFVCTSPLEYFNDVACRVAIRP